MAVPLAVVQHRALLQRVLGARDLHGALPQLGRRRDRELQRVERDARVSFRARGEEVERLGGHRDRCACRPVGLIYAGARSVSGTASVRDRRHQLAGVKRAAQHLPDLLRGQRPQRVHPHPRQQRAVDLERGVLRGRADQRHHALLHSRQQRVLLGLVEAVDLIEEEHRAGVARGAAVGGALQHRAHLRAAGLHRAQLFEHGAGALGDHPRECRLARARRAVEHHRVGVALFDRGAQPRAFAQQVRLSDELLQVRWPHARSQRTGLLGLLRLQWLEKGVHIWKLSREVARWGVSNSYGW